MLPFCIDPSMPAGKQQWAKEYFSKRQIDRLYLVGFNGVTTPAIVRFKTQLEWFGLFGQLTQLVGFDPTPRAIAYQLSPRTVAWNLIVEDLSSLEPEQSDWNKFDETPSTLKGILREIGRVYAPALLANAKALQADQKEWEAEIDGARWVQEAFPYLGKCLQWINEQYNALGDADR